MHKKVPDVGPASCGLALEALLERIGREGIEPSRTHRPGDFKSLFSFSCLYRPLRAIDIVHKIGDIINLD